MLQGKFQNRYQDRQTPPSNSLKLIKNWDMLYETKSSPLFPPTKYAMVPQHGLFSLHTILEGPSPYTMAFPTPMVQLSDESQGSSPLQGHGSWLYVWSGPKMYDFRRWCLISKLTLRKPLTQHAWCEWIYKAHKLSRCIIYLLSVFTRSTPKLCTQRSHRLTPEC